MMQVSRPSVQSNKQTDGRAPSPPLRNRPSNERPSLFSPKAPHRTPISINPTTSHASQTKLYEKGKNEKNKSKVHKNDDSALPPSSLIAPTSRPLRTPLPRHHRTNPNRRPHNRIPRRALGRHAPPSSHGSRSAALNDGRGARAQHAARAILLVAPHHPSRMAGGENALATGAARGRRRSGGRRAGAVDGGFALAGDVDVCA
jgi:hypothetical protein